MRLKTSPLALSLCPIDCLFLEMPSNEPLRCRCAIYRPWCSPYSYFVRVDKNAPPDSHSFPGVLMARSRDGPADAGRAEETAKSAPSSSGSLEKARPRDGSSRKGRPPPRAEDGITSHDILLASRWQPLQRDGYKCVACCRMFPTLRSLKTHIKCGLKEGFSCKVYYQKLKAFWEKEHACQFSKCPGGGGSHSARKLK
uniref:spermatogenesis-associated protein 46 n=1 Tax=Euleptes europaea TaxID=460621 RepID=UPI00254087A8|nr:spermatogenesis-associated protein 46 [Euleptes europaea]